MSEEWFKQFDADNNITPEDLAGSSSGNGSLDGTEDEPTYAAPVVTEAKPKPKPETVAEPETKTKTKKQSPRAKAVAAMAGGVAEEMESEERPSAAFGTIGEHRTAVYGK
tara:strand:+ start:3571 stop:3900 length:330 start_codon:yes stop_codon:yes gene_type:complete